MKVRKVAVFLLFLLSTFQILISRPSFLRPQQESQQISFFNDKRINFPVLQEDEENIVGLSLTLRKYLKLGTIKSFYSL